MSMYQVHIMRRGDEQGWPQDGPHHVTTVTAPDYAVARKWEIMVRTDGRFYGVIAPVSLAQ